MAIPAQQRAGTTLFSTKTALLQSYLCLLIGLCTLPFVLQLRSTKVPAMGTISATIFGAIFGVAGLTLVVTRGIPALTSALFLSIAFVVPICRDWRSLLGGLIALPLLAATTWWNPAMQLGPVQASGFVLLGILAATLPRLLLRQQGVPLGAAIPVMLLLGALAVLCTGVFSTPLGLLTLWHHWSVYVSAAESLQSGAIPFRDFPVQYGYGPMLAVATLCRDECWTATYLVVAAANLLYLLSMGGCVLALMVKAPRGLACLALVAMICAVLLWTGYPPDEVGPMAAPSVAGLRFLPLATLLLYITVAENCAFQLDAVGHALWLFAFVWSPEAAFQASAVWWPYLGLRRAQAMAAGQPIAIAIATLRGAGVALAALAIAGVALAVLFRSIFHEWPSLVGFTAYVRNPPGVMEVNMTGPIWLGLCGVAVTVIALLQADARGLRVGFVCLMGLLTAGSYYLGRSHDNNLLNLLPFFVLAVTAALADPVPRLVSGFAIVALAGVVAFPATFGWHAWTVAWRNGEARTIGPTRFIENIRFETADAWALFNQGVVELAVPHAPAEDAAAAMNWLRSHGEKGTPVWVSAAMLLPYGTPSDVWTGMNDLGSYGLLPFDEVEHFVRHSAETLHRVGWLLVDRTKPSPWPAIFFTAYSVTEEHIFGDCTLYRLAPK